MQHEPMSVEEIAGLYGQTLYRLSAMLPSESIRSERKRRAKIDAATNLAALRADHERSATQLATTMRELATEREARGRMGAVVGLAVSPSCGSRDPRVMHDTDTVTKFPCRLGYKQQTEVCNDLGMCRAGCPHSKTVAVTCDHPFHAALDALDAQRIAGAE